MMIDVDKLKEFVSKNWFMKSELGSIQVIDVKKIIDFINANQVEQSPFKKISNAIDTDTIDKDCPLQDVEATIDFVYGLKSSFKLETKEILVTTKIEPKDIDYIIIVKKPKGTDKEGK